jgi:hypothetical protein
VDGNFDGDGDLIPDGYDANPTFDQVRDTELDDIPDYVDSRPTEYGD